MGGSCRNERKRYVLVVVGAGSVDRAEVAVWFCFWFFWFLLFLVDGFILSFFLWLILHRFAAISVNTKSLYLVLPFLHPSSC